MKIALATLSNQAPAICRGSDSAADFKTRKELALACEPCVDPAAKSGGKQMDERAVIVTTQHRGVFLATRRKRAGR